MSRSRYVRDKMHEYGWEADLVKYDVLLMYPKVEEGRPYAELTARCEPDRGDCAGMGPTSTTPWAEFSMRWWADRVPKEKLVMGLPAYSNDYSALPGWGGGNGTQAGVGPPAATEHMCNETALGKPCTDIEPIW